MSVVADIIGLFTIMVATLLVVWVLWDSWWMYKEFAPTPHTRKGFINWCISEDVWMLWF